MHLHNAGASSKTLLWPEVSVFSIKLKKGKSGQPFPFLSQLSS